MLDLPPDLCQDTHPVCHLSPCILLIISHHIKPSSPECICNLYIVFLGEKYWVDAKGLLLINLD